MIDIDINEISEALNDKADIELLEGKADIDLDNTQPKADYVIDYGQSEDGRQWYRLWKSGWLEQGSTKSVSITYSNPGTTVLLLKPYKSASSYSINISNNVPSSYGSGGNIAISNEAKTESSFAIRSINSGYIPSAYWTTFGFTA